MFPLRDGNCGCKTRYLHFIISGISEVTVVDEGLGIVIVCPCCDLQFVTRESASVVAIIQSLEGVGDYFCCGTNDAPCTLLCEGLGLT